eukprot:624510_1
MLKIAVLGSTRGTTFQAIIDAVESKTLDVSIEAVVSNRSKSYILERARNHKIPAYFVGVKGTANRAEYDKKVSAILTKAKVDVVLLIGWMRIMSPEFVRTWHRRVLNVHPSLLPKFAGGMDKNGVPFILWTRVWILVKLFCRNRAPLIRVRLLSP